MDTPASEYSDPAGPGPAPASGHPYPLSRDARASRARALAMLAAISAGAICHAVVKFRDLLDEAEADIGCARRSGEDVGYGRGRRDAANGPQPG